MVVKIVEKYIMKKIELEELRCIQLDILKCIDEFCRKNDIRYSLGGGTLLGAVRHKGYIPWDDDIDIIMPRVDYDKFVRTFDKYKPHLICGAYENDASFIYPFSKVYDNRTVQKEHDFKVGIGVNVDLFPIDGSPNREKARRWHYQKVFIWRLLLSARNKNAFGIKRFWIKPFVDIIPLAVFQKNLQRLYRKYDLSQSKYAGSLISGFNDCSPAEIFNSYIELPFEGFKFMAIRNYDIYLHVLYGNYMQFPPVEQRVPSHKSMVYWNE